MTSHAAEARQPAESGPIHSFVVDSDTEVVSIYLARNVQKPGRKTESLADLTLKLYGIGTRCCGQEDCGSAARHVHWSAGDGC